ncbi:MAG TPA: RidA family protein [Stellaceae bacterium]|jgi:enamine deaminase RidA (YjgF/YER057c/UK114 family)|nr:RidA family protein [Stellaceae bacterium]
MATKTAGKAAGKIEARLAELTIELPDAMPPVANYIPALQTGDLMYIAGQICQWNGEVRFIGKCGRDFDHEQGRLAARLCGLNIIAQLRHALYGDLDRVVRCVRIGGFVNSTPDFTDQPLVVNGCSDLMVEVFGDPGKHARTSIGVAALPAGAAVEVEGIFQVRGDARRR